MTSHLFSTKKNLKKKLVQKKLQELKNFIIFLPNPILKQNFFRINKSAFLKLNSKIFNLKTIPANALITTLSNKQNNLQKFRPIFFVYNNVYLLDTQNSILDNFKNYSKLTTILLFYIKFIKILKIYSVKKN